MTALVTTITRRDFGIPFQVYICRCGACRWRTEVRELSTAVALCQKHTCDEEAA